MQPADRKEPLLIRGHGCHGDAARADQVDVTTRAGLPAFAVKDRALERGTHGSGEAEVDPYPLASPAHRDRLALLDRSRVGVVDVGKLERADPARAVQAQRQHGRKIPARAEPRQAVLAQIVRPRCATA